MAALSWKPEMVGPGQKAVTVTRTRLPWCCGAP